MRVAVLLFLASLAGCAVPTTGVVPLSDGLEKITHQGNGAWVSTESLKIAAVQEADQYCRTQGKRVRVIDTKHTMARPLGGWPEAEVLFKCEGEAQAPAAAKPPTPAPRAWIKS